MSILVYKNLEARNILENHNIFDLFERKAIEYLEIMEFLIKTSKSKDKAYSDKKVETIGKTIMKYYEFSYYYMLSENDDKDIIFKFKSKIDSYYNTLRKLVEDNRSTIQLNDSYDVFHWIERKYNECNEETTPY